MKNNDANEHFLISQKGYDKLNKELNHLINNIRPKVIEELAIARSHGDLSENADFDAAKQKQAEIEERIKIVSNQISYSKIINHKPSEIGIGTIIKFKYCESGKVDSIKIVGIIEADPFKKLKLLSYNCNFAQAIIKNKKLLHPGFILTIPLEKHSIKIEIIKIK